MQNFSQTQFGNIMQILSMIIVVFGGKALTPDQIDAVWVTIGMIVEVIGFVTAWLGRHKKGDLKLSGFRKPSIIDDTPKQAKI